MTVIGAITFHEISKINNTIDRIAKEQKFVFMVLINVYSFLILFKAIDVVEVTGYRILADQLKNKVT
jgi:hypothetical protein